MKRFFHNISWAQIFAGALAAVTAFLLSAKIGIAGSVIGVAVGSIVSTVTTQIYQRVLDESSKKIQKTVVSVHYNPNRSENDGDDDKSTSEDQSDLEATQTLPASDATSKRTGRQAVGHSTHANGAGETKITGKPKISPFGGHKLDGRKRKVLIVAIVSAIVAFGGTAGIIYAVTNGQGTDQVVRNIVSPSKTAAPEPSQSNTTPNGPRPSRSNEETSEPEPSQASPSSHAPTNDDSTATPSSSSSQSSGSSSTPSSSSSSSPSSSASASSSSSTSPSASASSSTAQPEAGSTTSSH
ncbi:hypothetical protein [Bifidobacterium aquikefiricola]|uniref:ABC transporter permease n=1 Tax=Bifidobacterium aquikefiricola TaxID=3059038 RepID=A0AB39U4I4_9BIFI